MSMTGVCHGAMLRCAFGSTLSTLLVSRHATGTEASQAFATVEDNHPLRNIQPFGNCFAAAHPLAHTGAAPCVPQTHSLWELRAPSVRYEQRVALRGDASLRCEYGGVITVLQPGQQATQVTEQGS